MANEIIELHESLFVSLWALHEIIKSFNLYTNDRNDFFIAIIEKLVIREME